MSSNCPNCGAPITGAACDYCGTVFERPEEVLSLAVGRKLAVSFEHGGRLYEFDMVIDRANVEASHLSNSFYANDHVYAVTGNTEYEASFGGRLVPGRKHGRDDVYFICRELSPEEITC